eukprot:15125793-Alexandrium_andersonii.AAC.1
MIAPRGSAAIRAMACKARTCATRSGGRCRRKRFRSPIFQTTPETRGEASTSSHPLRRNTKLQKLTGSFNLWPL